MLIKHFYNYSSLRDEHFLKMVKGATDGNNFTLNSFYFKMSSIIETPKARPVETAINHLSVTVQPSQMELTLVSDLNDTENLNRKRVNRVFISQRLRIISRRLAKTRPSQTKSATTTILPCPFQSQSICRTATTSRSRSTLAKRASLSRKSNRILTKRNPRHTSQAPK